METILCLLVIWVAYKMSDPDNDSVPPPDPHDY